MTPMYLGDEEVKVTRVRITADVDAELRRRVKIAAVRADRSVSGWVEEALTRELEREARETAAVSRVSVPAFARDWDSEDDAVYDGIS